MNKSMAIFRYSFFTSLILFSFNSFAEDYFDPALLDGQLGVSANEIDLSQFSQKDALPEGKISLLVYVNNNNNGEYIINLVKGPNNKVVPEITRGLLDKLGVNTEVIPKLNMLKSDQVIYDINEYIPDALIKVNLSELKLITSFPQIVMSNDAIGYIDPASFDSGVTAMFINYMFSGGHSSNDSNVDKINNNGKQKNDNFFAQLRAGFNLYDWRLRSTMTQTYTRNSNNAETQSNNSNKFSNTYLSRNLYSLRSEFIIGETTTGNDVFDSIPMKGMRLVSNEQMLPASQQGFAPDVSGIAQSNAQITIRQNGNVIYQTYVAPGAFKITDLYASGSGGNLDVTVKEEDGSERTFTVAFSSLPVMLRPDGWKYEISTGRFDGGTTVGSKKADFLLASGIYGLPHDVTLYGGVLGAKDYYAISSGIGISLGNWGALSADITHAHADFNTIGSQNGQSYRFRYSKNMTTTGTSVDLTALRFSTKDYYDFNQFNTEDYRLKEGTSPWLGEREKSRFTTSLSQSLGQYGSIYLSGSRYNYWEQNKNVTQLTTGYNSNIHGINFGINYSIDRIKSDDSWPENRQISFNVSVPFSVFSNSPALSNFNSTYMINHDNNGRTNQQVGLSGSAFDNSLSYGISQSWANQGQSNNGSAYANYSGNYGTSSLNYNYSSDYYNVNGSMNGGLLLHSGGLLLGRSMGNSMAIVEAPGATGTELSSGNGAINRQGYALSPYLTEYRQNTIALNVNTLPDNTTLQSTSQNVVPTKGAIVKIAFKTKIGFQAILNLSQNKSVVPFGAIATLIDADNPNDLNTGIVGENGQLYMSGLPDNGKLLVKWGNKNQQSCSVSYSGLSDIEVNSRQPIRILSLSCQ
ncbi:fimbria/pilus outer membrane usher protein [Proteus faecis]|uniref:fimbria/pilus outer membrane usher protein n=1 Tax=Proteus faecis TaxID=2050967 RepID=UPI0020BDA1DD